MTALPAVTSAVTLRALEARGFCAPHKGSHHYLKHPERPALRVTVPFHRGDLPPGTLRSIIRQAGLTVDEFVAFLF